MRETEHGIAQPDIERRVREIVAMVLDVDATMIDDDASSDTISSWSSLAHMNLVLALEDEFGVRFEEHMIPDVMSFRRLCEVLESLAQSR